MELVTRAAEVLAVRIERGIEAAEHHDLRGGVALLDLVAAEAFAEAGACRKRRDRKAGYLVLVTGERGVRCPRKDARLDRYQIQSDLRTDVTHRSAVDHLGGETGRRRKSRGQYHACCLLLILRDFEAGTPTKHGGIKSTFDFGRKLRLDRVKPDLRTLA